MPQRRFIFIQTNINIYIHERKKNTTFSDLCIGLSVQQGKRNVSIFQKDERNVCVFFFIFLNFLCVCLKTNKDRGFCTQNWKKKCFCIIFYLNINYLNPQYYDGCIVTEKFTIFLIFTYNIISIKKKNGMKKPCLGMMPKAKIFLFYFLFC